MTNDLIPADRQTSASKVLAVLQSFGAYDGVVTLDQAARHTGLPRSTAHRMLTNLRKAGLVELSGRRYLLSGRMAELAAAAPSDSACGLTELVLPSLTDLYEATREASQLIVRRGNSAMVAEGVHGSQSVGVLPRPTGLMPLHCTAAGKVLLAHSAPLDPSLPLVGHTAASITSHLLLGDELRRVRKYGVAFDRGEWFHGLTGVAAPVWGPGRVLMGAISVMGPFGRLVPDAIAPRVRRIADIASRELHTSRFAAPVLAS